MLRKMSRKVLTTPDLPYTMLLVVTQRDDLPKNIRFLRANFFLFGLQENKVKCCLFGTANCLWLSGYNGDSFGWN